MLMSITGVLLAFERQITERADGFDFPHCPLRLPAGAGVAA